MALRYKFVELPIVTDETLKEALKGQYTFKLVPIPVLGQESQNLAVKIGCLLQTSSKDKARDALMHQAYDTLPSERLQMRPRTRATGAGDSQAVRHRRCAIFNCAGWPHLQGRTGQSG